MTWKYKWFYLIHSNYVHHQHLFFFHYLMHLVNVWKNKPKFLSRIKLKFRLEAFCFGLKEIIFFREILNSWHFFGLEVSPNFISESWIIRDEMSVFFQETCRQIELWKVWIQIFSSICDTLLWANLSTWLVLLLPLVKRTVMLNIESYRWKFEIEQFCRV